MRAQHHPPPCLFVLDYLTDWSALNVQLFNFHAWVEPRCAAVTLSTTRASLVELHFPTSSADLGTVASVMPLSPLAILHTSARALANTVLEIILGTCQVSWALSLSTPLPLPHVPAASPGDLELSALAMSQSPWGQKSVVVLIFSYSHWLMSG